MRVGSFFLVVCIVPVFYLLNDAVFKSILCFHQICFKVGQLRKWIFITRRENTVCGIWEQRVEISESLLECLRVCVNVSLGLDMLVAVLCFESVLTHVHPHEA